MFTKILFLLYIIYFVKSHDVIPKYGSKTVNDNNIFLDVSEFNINDEIYISVESKTGSCIDSLDYSFYNDIENIHTFTTTNNVYSSSSSSVTMGVYESFTYYYTITKNVQGNYLYLEYNCPYPVIVENTEKYGGTVIYIVAIVIVVLFFAILIFMGFHYCKRCKIRHAATMYENQAGYSASPYSVQPVIGVNPIQPVMNAQPYGKDYSINPNYNYGQYNSNVPYINVQGNPAAPLPQETTSHRKEKVYKYKKPKV
jgi:hypothetical protein